MVKLKRKSQTLKKKKKKWVSIVAPSDFGRKELGEAYVSESEDLIGKEVKVNMMFVAKTRNSNIRLTFQVTNTKEGTGITELTSYKILPSYVKRMVRKRKSKLDISQVIKSKEGKEFTIKYVILTRGKVSKGVLTSIGKSARELILSESNKKPSKKVFDDVMYYSLQKDMKKKLSKIYPIGLFEVRFLKKK
tara:strand:- start:791 stop:1363 length:573 start_codon:yes stop_codon:yes gene_type:complete